MSKDKDQPKESKEDVTEEAKSDVTEKTKKMPSLVMLIIFAVIAVFVISSIADKNAKPVKSEIPETVSAPIENEVQKDANDNTAQEADIDKAAESTAQQTGDTQVSNVAFDLENAKTPRILGDPNAPVKISEHSSFTCGGCAMFHKDNFKRIKQEYIDTGKAYIVFDDFPRNSFDITIGSVARCVPEQAYFNFVQLLFETQKTWLNDGYMTYLKQNAKLTGASEAQINNCLESKELHETLAQHQEAANKNHGVKSTPTLVINDTVVISGLEPYEKIKAAIDAAIAKAAE